MRSKALAMKSWHTGLTAPPSVTSVSFVHVLMIAAAAAGPALAQTPDATPSPGGPEIVEVTAFPETIEQRRTCRVAYADPVPVRAPLSGVISLSVGTGDTVRVSEVLGRFDSAAQERTRLRLQAQKELLELRRQRQVDEIEPRQDFLRQSRLRELSDELADAEADLAKLRDLARSGRVSDGEVDAARDRVESLRRSRSETSANNELAQIDAELRIAQLEFDILSTRLNLEEVEESIALTVVEAPASGLVIDIAPGLDAAGEGLVREGSDLMRIADPLRMSARVEVSEEDMLGMRDAAVTVASTTRPGLVVEGRIASVTPLTDQVFGQADYEIVVAFTPGRAGDWEVDTRASCRFAVSTGQSDGAAVPVSAVRFDGGAPFVERLRPDGAFDPQPVVLGRQGPSVIEVVEGLKVGDLVRR